MFSPINETCERNGNNTHGETVKTRRTEDVMDVLEGSVGWNGNPCEIIEEFRLGGQNDGLAWTAEKL
jgi:hypothetical protein